jgi:hypothetical protein
MTARDEGDSALAHLDRMLAEAYLGRERLSRDELHRHAVEADLPAEAMALLDQLPEGEYAQDEAAEALRAIPNRW